MSAVEDIRIKLETRLRELEEEIESLRGALTALESQAAESGAAPTTSTQAAASGPSASQPPGRSRRGRRSRGTGSRDKRDGRHPSPELERLLAETGGMSAVELARQTGTDYGEVLARIQELEMAGRTQDKA